MKSILVTGATSGLGRSAVAFLLRRGLRVLALGRDQTVLETLTAQGAQTLRLDLSRADEAQLLAAVSKQDAVWHCAALSSPWGVYTDFHAANVRASEYLFRASLKAGVPRFIHISTPALYFDFTHRHDIREDFKPARYVNHYAATKALAEERLQALLHTAQGPTHLGILRPRALFGQHDRVLFPRLLKVFNRETGKIVLPRAGRTVLDLTYVDNVVHAMWAATFSDFPNGMVFNITNDEPVSVADALTCLLVEELGYPLKIRSLPYPLMAGIAAGMEAFAGLTRREPSLTRYSLGALAFDMSLNIDQAKHHLDYRPAVSLREGLALTAQSLRAQHG